MRERLLAVLALGLCLGCRARAEASRPLAEPTPEDITNASAALQKGKALHFTHLRPFFPAELLEYQAGPFVASTARFGDTAATEAERRYLAGALKARVKIIDTNLARKPPTDPAEPFEDELHLGRPLVVPGAVGFVEYDKRTQRAHANLVVAQRFVVGVTCDNAPGPEAVERLCAALDLKGLGRLAQPSSHP